MNLVAFTSDTVSVFHVIDEMKQRGWYIQPQLGFGDSKENIHLSINPASVRWVDALLADLDACIEIAKGLPSGELAAKIRAASAASIRSSSGPRPSRACSGWPACRGPRCPGAWPRSTRC